MSLFSDFRTRTPKGDGNKRRIKDLRKANRDISEHEPRKGTETIGCHTINKSLHSISEHEPRKGTETREPCMRTTPRCHAFQNTNPERGRKLYWYSNQRPTSIHFRTRTPKGDGNDFCLRRLAPAVLISEHEPRKGTETQSGSLPRTAPRNRHFRTRTPKGDGNLRSSIQAISL